MFALYVDHAGTVNAERFDVVRLLMAECRMPLADAKLVLAGVRVKVMTAEVAVLQTLQEKLEDIGARAFVGPCPEESDEALLAAGAEGTESKGGAVV